MKWLLRSIVFQGSIVFQEPHLCIGLCAVQALQGEVCSVWPESHPLPEHLRRPHHPLPRPSHQGQRHHQDRSGDQQDHGLHQVVFALS
ncbi:40S ribosomal protein S4-3 [Zea mays]|uniref:40S ribosomal protein S4-3 n=1 Tax=Zea mays TaxID=4577 RepID=A0A1D6EIV0_MAIZE|nr:40S ribosomal protein S4-3 [Zea mays]ONM20025.1 40S ribosomal protein S4-3 [Zea mays]ONM20026.1 40S ribosomal protein S4-3 [Zea mays]ONM20027.1 40S ribosomal protein S4-3 [Zea mays]ONM20028.1 40S ribosomal protein S4-3 [Zea mays]